MGQRATLERREARSQRFRQQSHRHRRQQRDGWRGAHQSGQSHRRRRHDRRRQPALPQPLTARSTPTTAPAYPVRQHQRNLGATTMTADQKYRCRRPHDREQLVERRDDRRKIDLNAQLLSGGKLVLAIPPTISSAPPPATRRMARSSPTGESHRRRSTIGDANLRFLNHLDGTVYSDAAPAWPCSATPTQISGAITMTG